MQRDFVNYRDVVRANLMALDDDRMVGEQYNIGGGTAYSVLDFAKLVARVAGHPELAPKVPGVFRYGDTRNSCSDISKMHALGWEPRHTAEESVTEYVNWLREQTDIDDIFDYAERNMRQLNVLRESSQQA